MQLLKSELKANRWILIISSLIFFTPLILISVFYDKFKNIQNLEYFIIVFNFAMFFYLSISYLNIKYGKFKKVLMSLPINKEKFIQSSLIYIVLMYFGSMLFGIIVIYTTKFIFPDLHLDFIFNGAYYMISITLFIMLTYILTVFQFGFRGFYLVLWSFFMPLAYFSLFWNLFKFLKLDNMRFIGLFDNRFSGNNIFLLIGYVFLGFLIFLISRFISVKTRYKYSIKKALFNSLKISTIICMVIIIIALMFLFSRHILVFYPEVMSGYLEINWHYLSIFTVLFTTLVGLLFWMQKKINFKINLVLGIFVLVGNFMLFITLFLLQIFNPAIVNIVFIIVQFYLLYKFLLKIEPFKINE